MTIHVPLLGFPALAYQPVTIRADELKCRNYTKLDK